MAGIKFHGAVDVQIMNNRIYRTCLGVWLDWMAQGAQVKNNLLHDNSLDVFLEVNHGPILVSNNILLSEKNLLMNSSGVAFVHNLFGGKTEVIDYDARLTPYHRSHSTFVEALHDNPGGDVRFCNNLFTEGGDISQYSKALLPVVFEGNVYTKGAVTITGSKDSQRFGEMNSQAQKQMEKYKEQSATETRAIVDKGTDARMNLLRQDGNVYLEMTVNRKWLAGQNRNLVTSELLGHAIIPNLPFRNTDGSPVVIDTGYSGEKRNRQNPSPGPFEFKSSGKQKVRVW